MVKINENPKMICLSLILIIGFVLWFQKEYESPIIHALKYVVGMTIVLCAGVCYVYLEELISTHRKKSTPDNRG